jgi:predicted O-methyltransferase YrrM
VEASTRTVLAELATHGARHDSGLADRLARLRTMKPEAADGSVSAIVLDAERPAYPAYWPHLLRVLAPGGFVAVDNAISHAAELVAFRDLVDATPGTRSDLFALGDGILVITR